MKNDRVIEQIFISHPQGKMNGIPTITTSMLCNPICEQRAKDETSVCAHCYAKRGLAIYPAARNRYAENTKILSSHDLEVYELPVLNSSIARFESHGDLVNVTHAKNYIRIARRTRGVRLLSGRRTQPSWIRLSKSLANRTI